MLSQDLETNTGDTFWTQYTTAGTSGAGQPIALNDTAPANDRWNLAAVEVRPSSEMFDTEPPETSMVNPTSGEIVSNKVSLSANATDNVGVASVQFELDGKPIGNPVTKLPYAFKWDSDGGEQRQSSADGPVPDTSGNTAESAPVEVMVENPTPPGPCFIIDRVDTVRAARPNPDATLHHRRRRREAVRVRLGGRSGTKETGRQSGGRRGQMETRAPRQLHAGGRRDLVRGSQEGDQEQIREGGPERPRAMTSS